MPNQRFDVEEVHAISALDVTAGALQALCEFKRLVYSNENDTFRVNLLVDVSDSALHIESDLPERGTLRVTPAMKANLEVRIPSWVNPKAIGLKVGGKERSVAGLSGPYLPVTDVMGGEEVLIAFPVAVRKSNERVFGHEYQTEWRGDTLTSLKPEGKDQPMYQADPPPTQVWGRVTDAGTGAGVPGFSVALLSGSGEAIASAETDGGGNYAIDASTATGKYSLRVNLHGGSGKTFPHIAMERAIPKTANFRVEGGSVTYEAEDGGAK
jgi:hypothetical protein